MADLQIGGLDPRFYLDRIGSATKKPETPKTQDDFSGFLKSAIEQVNEIQKNADTQVTNMAQGNIEDIHTAMMELQKADISFQAMMEIRNKILEAYQEVMRMQM